MDMGSGTKKGKNRETDMMLWIYLLIVARRPNLMVPKQWEIRVNGCRGFFR